MRASKRESVVYRAHVIFHILFIKIVEMAFNGFRVAVVGAAGGIGQPLSLLLKQNPLVRTLSLYDLAPVTPGVGADISHIDTGARVQAFTGPDQLGAALKYF
jgi:hypothetical protein